MKQLNQSQKEKEDLLNQLNIMEDKLRFTSRLLKESNDKLNSFKLKIEEATSAIEFKTKFEQINPILKELVKNEISNYNVPKSGLRYSNCIKCFSLYLYYTSPKCYGILKSFFRLPSKSTLNKQVDDKFLRTGLHSSMITFLENCKFNDKENIFSLVLDKVHLKPFLVYDLKSGMIINLIKLY